MNDGFSDEFDEENGDYGYYMSYYQDGIDENARRHRRHKRSIHRYPHHTHERRVTDHSLGDQGPTHYGQQHPYHPDHLTQDQQRRAPPRQ